MFYHTPLKCTPNVSFIKSALDENDHLHLPRIEYGKRLLEYVQVNQEISRENTQVHFLYFSEDFRT